MSPAWMFSPSRESTRMLVLWLMTTLAAATPRDPEFQDDVKSLCELLLAAQDENVSKYAAGDLEFRIEYQRAKRDALYLTAKPALAVVEGKLIWEGDLALWRYFIHDPDRSIATSERSLPLGTGPEESMLVRGEDHFTFKPDINQVVITKYNNRFHGNVYLDVRPHSLWFRIFSPLHLDPVLLADVIGPGSRAEMPGDVLEVKRDGNRVVHTRTRSSGSSTTLVFSLADDGNLLERRIVYAPGPDGVVTRALYEWGRAPTGECYPSRYRQEQFLAGDERDILGYYSVDIISINLAPRDRSPELSKEALFARLPENTRVDDQIRKVVYMLHPRATLSTKDLDRLVPAVQARGYLKR